MPNQTDPSPAATIAQIVGMIVMTLVSVYWVAIDYPDWLPASVLAAIPRPDIGTTANWVLIFAGTGIGWGIYQWGTVKKARQAAQKSSA